MRRLALLLCALLVLIGANMARTVSVYASRPGCEVATDQNEVIYTDWHNQTFNTVYDSWPGGNPSHNVYIDLWSWRLSSYDPFSAVVKCYRAYYASAWTDDNSAGNFTAFMRTWVCNDVTPVSFWRNTQWSNRTDTWTVHPFGPSGNSNRSVNITLPNGVATDLWAADYGPYPIENGCLPRADTYSMQAGSPTWTPSNLFSEPGGIQGWYCHDRSGPQGNNFYCP